MSTDSDIQLSFLQWVKEKSNGEFSFVDELAYLLDISRDSAYRRLRGETLLTFNEIRKISEHYKASLDTFFQLSTETVLFKKRTIGENYTYIDFLKSVLFSVKLIDKEKGHKMIYVAKDIPPFHYFIFPVLSQFKSFFWLKTILKDPKLENIGYTDNVLDPEIAKVTQEIWKSYSKIPSLEIWSDETINITMRQVEYYFESNLITPDQTHAILNDMQKMIELIKKEAEYGKKFTIVDKPNDPENGEFELYHNDIEIGDNTVFFSMDQCMVLKTYNMLNVLTTTDDEFCSDIDNYIQNILRKSVPISSSSEKERIKFFNHMIAKIDKFRVKLGLSENSVIESKK